LDLKWIIANVGVLPSLMCACLSVGVTLLEGGFTVNYDYKEMETSDKLRKLVSRYLN